ncbi:SDR family NAD(P)-dependent oxidoreductase [Sphingomonas bacterium]|uniref:SDR family NAD(P)-dependent oxidoreductase n=1 Tax=Sphingomonas bacterium TaxID=1895847 RepID=UPI001576A1ED|nr:SDR family oxidoreductase [Sphingomonas bacterium]
MARLTGRSVIVTGGARGIGAAYALALAGEGAKVAVCDILDCAATVAAVEQAGGEAIGQVCDITDADAVAAFVGAVIERFGGVDGLVNNAALFATLRTKPVEQVSSDEFDQVLRVNVRGTFEMIKAVLPAMKRKGYGKIVNIASGTLFKGTPFMVPYVASKGALLGITRSVAREVGSAGICVNCVAPGLTMSEAIGDNPDYSGDLAAMTVKSRCIPRDQQPEDLNGIVIFLLSAESDFMTGQTVVVDGGSIMN